jgi:WD40 repeat protein
VGAHDGSVSVLSASGEATQALQAHDGPVAAVAAAPGVLVTAAADSVAVWATEDGKWAAPRSVPVTTGSVAALAVHPCRKLALAAAGDRVLVLDLDSASIVAQMSAPAPVTGVAIHPDGKLVLAVVKDSVLVYNLLDQTLAATIAAEGALEATVSENGYLVLARTQAGAALCDLRKTAVTHSFACPGASSVDVDASGAYAAVASPEGVNVLKLKDLSLVAKIEDVKALKVMFGDNDARVFAVEEQNVKVMAQ